MTGQIPVRNGMYKVGFPIEFKGLSKNTVTIASGNVLSVGGTNTIQPTLSAGAIAFGATDAKLFTVSDLVLGLNAPITGTGIASRFSSSARPSS